jgi:hypothetical protein
MSQLSQRLEDALLAAAGEGRTVAPVSLTIDYGVAADGAEASIKTRLDRSTRSLVFASAQAVLPDGRTAASASGVYRVTV